LTLLHLVTSFDQNRKKKPAGLSIKPQIEASIVWVEVLSFEKNMLVLASKKL
jgi:hypothetical protein